MNLKKMTTTIGVFKNRLAAERANRALIKAGFSTVNLSVHERGYRVIDADYYQSYEQKGSKFWGGKGAFWGGFPGFIAGASLAWIPVVVGFFLAGGYVALILVSAEVALLVFGLLFVGTGLFGLAFPANKVLGYSKVAKGGQFVVMAENKRQDQRYAVDVMLKNNPVGRVKTFEKDHHEVFTPQSDLQREYLLFTIL